MRGDEACGAQGSGRRRSRSRSPCWSSRQPRTSAAKAAPIIYVVQRPGTAQGPRQSPTHAGQSAEYVQVVHQTSGGSQVTQNVVQPLAPPGPGPRNSTRRGRGSIQGSQPGRRLDDGPPVVPRTASPAPGNTGPVMPWARNPFIPPVAPIILAPPEPEYTLVDLMRSHGWVLMHSRSQPGRSYLHHPGTGQSVWYA